MEQLNRIELRGTVGNCRCQELESGGVVAHLTLVTNYAYKSNKNGDVIETNWTPVTVWQNKYLPDLKSITKGMRIGVVGRLKTSKWTDSEGKNRDAQEVVADKLEIIEESLSVQM